MRSDFESDVFGKEKDGSFESVVAQISKGFGKEDFYPTLQEKAATLLCLIVKNHGFIDGIKRIARSLISSDYNLFLNGQIACPDFSSGECPV